MRRPTDKFTCCRLVQEILAHEGGASGVPSPQQFGRGAVVGEG